MDDARGTNCAAGTEQARVTEQALLVALDQLLGAQSETVAPPSFAGPYDKKANDHQADRHADRHADSQVQAVLASWAAAPIDPVVVANWTPQQARQGLAALELVRRRVAAVNAVLVTRVGLGRDSAADLTRTTGMSQRPAREAVRVAETVANNPEIGERLVNGDVSAAQVGAVAGLESADALELLDVATSQSDDEFARSVERFKVDQGGRTRADRQRTLRSVRFGEGPEGCLRITAVLPPTEGAEVRGALDRICDRRWKDAHPERARKAGGHDDEPRERRLADALVELARGGARSGRSSGGGSGAGQVPAVVVTVDAETLRTTLLPDTPLDPSVLGELLARAQVFAAIRDHTKPARLSFGRNRRLASPMQRLVLAMLQPRCTTGGCDVPAHRCEAHHRIEYDSGGLTDLDNLVNLCPAHHHHLHDPTNRAGP